MFSQILNLRIYKFLEGFYLVEKQNKENFVKKYEDSGIVKTCDELDLDYLH